MATSPPPQSESAYQPTEVPDAPPQPEAPAAAGPEPVYYKHLDVGAALSGFAPPAKNGSVYEVPLLAPVWVQTPPLTLVSPLEDEDGAPLAAAHVALSPSFAKFCKDAEARILAACIANKATWFKRKVDDESLRAGFKEFCKGRSLKIRVPRDALFFDGEGALVPRQDVGEGCSVRCLLELSKICFGRTEFGCMWTLLQAQTAPPPPPPPRCMIDPAAEGCEEPAVPAADAEVQEFF